MNGTPVDAKANNSQFVRILHLSDLHLETGTRINTGPLLYFKNRLASVQSNGGKFQQEYDLIFVTGDIADNSDWEQSEDAHLAVLKKGRDFLEKLAEERCVNGKKGLLVIPGNHDYRWFGNLKSSSSEAAFKEVFSDYFKTTIFQFERMRLLAVCLDSNAQHVTRPLEFARGYVDPNELADLSMWLDTVGGDLRTIKIALVHHHPLPVAESDTEMEAEGKPGLFLRMLGKKANLQKLGGAPEYMLLRNSGTVLHRLLEHDFRLVLHGHLHQHGYWRTFARTYKNEDRWIEVISGGSVGRPDESSVHNFNVLTVHNDGYIEAFQYGWRKNGDPVATIKIPSTPYEVICESELDASQPAVEAPQHLKGECLLYRSDRYIQSWELDLGMGDFKSSDLVQGIRKLGDKELDEIVVQNVSDTLTLTKFTAEIDQQSHNVEACPPEYQKTASASKIVYKLRFSPGLNDKPVDLRANFLLRGVMFMDLKDEQLFRKNLSGWDEAGYSVLNPTEQAVIRLRFAAGGKRQWVPKKLLCVVLDGDGNECLRERSSNRLVFHHWPSDETNSSWSEAILSIRKPRLFYTYLIKWEIRKATDSVTVTRRRSSLYGNLAKDAEGRQRGDAFVRSLHEIVQSYCTTQFAAARLKDTSGYIFAFNESEKILKCRATTATADDVLAVSQIAYGRDVIGTAFRRCEPIHFRSGQEAFELFKNVPPSFRCLIAFPLIDQDDPAAIGVFAVASTSTTSALRTLIDHHDQLPDLASKINDSWRPQINALCAE